jgi:endonuclease YncB( thermonuclease family)
LEFPRKLDVLELSSIEEELMATQPRTLSLGKVLLLCIICSVLGYVAATLRTEGTSVVATPHTTAEGPTDVDLSARIPSQDLPPTTPRSWTVARVLEPNLIELEGGAKVTLLGVAVPEQSTSELTSSALAFLKGAVEGRKVRLEFEPEDYIEKGSSLAYVYLEDGTLVNADLIKKGYLASSEGDYSLHGSFTKYESLAKQAKLGLWSVDESPEPDRVTEVVTDFQEETSPSTNEVVSSPAPIAPSSSYFPPARNYSNDSYTTSSQPTESPSYYIPPRPAYKPPVAENGSYYGEISERTGRPKTVHVNGYYRRDGTYVRGYYRSSPQR